MILTGTLPGSIVAYAAADTSDFVRYVTSTARRITTLDVMLEVIGLTVDQVWATFYVRGAMDPALADDHARDQYLRCLTRIGGDLGRAAREAFLRGWAEHRAEADRRRDVLAWHRFIGETAIELGREWEWVS